MRQYQQSMFRPIFGIAAVAMTAGVITLAVVAPSRVDANSMPRADATSAVPAATELAVRHARVDVVGQREQHTAFEPVRDVPAPKQAG